jgi:hypothetical protein
VHVANAGEALLSTAALEPWSLSTTRADGVVAFVAAYSSQSTAPGPSAENVTLATK